MADASKVTFDAALDRAKYLFRLHKGLVDRRKRAIRADWAQSFRQLMHWPANAVIQRVDGRDAVIVLRHGAALSDDDFDEMQLQDVLRASLVMAVSALDAYFHCKILANVVKQAGRGADMPGALATSTISISGYVAAKKYKRRLTAVRNAMSRSLGFQSLQQPKNIADSLAVIGIKNFWNGVASRRNHDAESIKNELSAIVKRRNQIAHEGDLSQERKNKNKPHAIGPALVDSAIQFIEVMVQVSEDEIRYQLENQ